MGIFISVEKTVECVLIALAFAVFLTTASYKVAGILQSCGYSNKKLFAWVKKKNNLTFERHVLLAMLCAFAYAVAALCLSFLGDLAPLLGLAVYAVFFIAFVYSDRKVALKCPATKSSRFVRLGVIMFLVSAVASYFAVTLINFFAYICDDWLFNVLKYIFLSLLPILIIPLLCLANGIDKIYEVPHNKKFIKAAKTKFANSNITVVGITGSYGKTSTKNILEQMLSAKYRALSTPRSYNTPIGIALAVDKKDLNDYDIFIAEMGARQVGDIAELCSICPPDYSIITGICPQHLQSFKSEQNIIKGKGEILLSTKRKAFIAEDCIDKFLDSPCLIQSPKCVSNIKTFSDKTQFDLTFSGESVSVTTKLLGKHSALNIAIAAEAAHELGLSLAEIAKVVEGLNFTEHRLQKIEANGINILDDGYNCNIAGAAAAIDVLKTFSGRKIVVTPGIVELGVLEREENAKLGANLVGLDFIILVGDTLVSCVKEGYLAAGGSAENIKTAQNLASAQAMLSAYLKGGDTVLFLNDLPDVYL